MSDLAYADKLHKGNDSFEPTRSYCMYLTVDGETYKIDQSAMKRAREALKYRPYTISRICNGDCLSGLEFYRRFLRSEV